MPGPGGGDHLERRVGREPGLRDVDASAIHDSQDLRDRRLPDRRRQRVGVSAGEYVDKTTQGEPIAVCEAADAAYVTIGSKTDWDGDGVFNVVDACPEVDGEPADDAHNGCPRVQRELTATFADEVVTGTMSASDSACLGSTDVVVSAIGANGSPSTVGQAQTAADGTFTAPLHPESRRPDSARGARPAPVRGPEGPLLRRHLPPRGRQGRRRRRAARSR